MTRQHAYRFIFFFIAIIWWPSDSSAMAVPPSSDEFTLSGSDGLVAYVSKKGAKIRVHRDVNDTSSGSGSGSGGSKGQTGEITIFLDAIEEVNGTTFQRLNGSTKIQSFSNVDFTITQRNDVTLPLMAAGVSSTAPVGGNCLQCNANLDKQTAGGGDAKLVFSVCAITTAGQMTMNGEVTEAKVGQLKIAFQLEGWKFNATTNKMTADIAIKVPAGRTAATNSSSSGGNKPAKYSLGSDAFAEFSRMVWMDNDTWFAMPTGYPFVYANGSSETHYTILMDYFNTSVMYDPNIEVGAEVTEVSDGAAWTTHSASSAVWILVLASCATLMQLLSKTGSVL